MDDRKYPYYQRTHHSLDVYPVPREKQPMYINEPKLIDPTIDDYCAPEFSNEPDNMRVYIPLDINAKTVLRRINAVIDYFGVATLENELDYMGCIERIIKQVEIYDQRWFIREMASSPDGKHSKKAVDLIEQIVRRLETVEDADSEIFPMCYIQDLKAEFGLK